MSRRHGAGLLCLALLAGLTVTGCSTERTFTAGEFVDEVKAEGVELQLGEELVTNEEGKDLYAVTLAPLPGAPRPPAEEGEQPGLTGSLGVYDEGGAADDGMQSCMAAVDLLCYQASNVVVIIEGTGLEAQRLGVAIKKLAED